MEKPDFNNCTEKEVNRWVWSDYYELCKKCKNSCKQSHVAIQVICNKFKRIEEEIVAGV